VTTVMNLRVLEPRSYLVDQQIIWTKLPITCNRFPLSRAMGLFPLKFNTNNIPGKKNSNVQECECTVATYVIMTTQNMRKIINCWSGWYTQSLSHKYTFWEKCHLLNTHSYLGCRD
jgi:hypothetical protein